MNFEKLQTEKEELFLKYKEKFSNIKEIALEDLEEMKDNGVSIEEFLNFINKEKDYLFHGSRVKLDEDDKIKSREGKIYASDNPAIAILKAIYSNRGANLRYPVVISEEYPLELLVNGANDNTVGENGYVYLIQKDIGFKSTRKGSFEYIKEYSEESFIKRFEVETSDFKYPVDIR